MKALVIAVVDVRRLIRERTNLFFLFVLPMLIIVLLGAASGSSAPRVGVYAGHGELAEGLVSSLEAEKDLTLQRFTRAADVERAVERSEIEVGVVAPDGYDATLRSGGTVTLRYIGRPDTTATQLVPTIRSAAARQSELIRTARLLEARHAASFDEGLRSARSAAPNIPRITVQFTDPAGDAYPPALGQFATSASRQLLLFIFFTSLTGASVLIETRRLGVARRMLSTPTSARTVMLGAGLGRMAIALLQALLIVLGAMALGVDWGSPLPVSALVFVFCLVGSGAGLLLGSVLAKEQQARAFAFLFGLGLAALGGSMAPLEIFPHTVRLIADVTPHAWANDAFGKLQRGGTLQDISTDLGVLLAMATALLALATWMLRRRLTT